MLDQLPFEQKEEPLVKTAYEICRCIMSVMTAAVIRMD